MKEVLLVDENDNIVGREEKLKAHRQGKLHRAFSVFVFNSDGKLLIQQRAKDKYHSGGLWSNTCCSHPVTDDIQFEAQTRLREEFGFSKELKEIFSFTYKVEFSNGLTEHELDHIFIGEYDGPVRPDRKEIMDYRWIDPEELKKDIKEDPDKYTHWLKLSLDRVISSS